MNQPLRLPAPDRSARPRRVRFGKDGSLFVLIVGLPTIVAALYFALLASDRYVSEARFIVRNVEPSDVGGVAAILQGFGFADASDPAYAVQSYLQSRDALQALATDLPMHDILAPETADVFGSCRRPWSTGGTEHDYRCYLRHVRVIREPVGGILRLEVDLYDAASAEAVANRLLALSEAFANGLNRRAEADMIRFAETSLDVARREVTVAQDALTAFRRENGLVDVADSARAAEALGGSLASELAMTRIAIERQEATSPLAPALGSLRAREAALDGRLTGERDRLVGGNEALALRMPDFETLVLARDMAGRSWQAAAQRVETAREDARRQSIYVDTIVTPNRPDQPIRPRRLRAVASVAAVSLALFGMLWLAITGMREHADEAW